MAASFSKTSKGRSVCHFPYLISEDKALFWKAHMIKSGLPRIIVLWINSKSVDRDLRYI